jgi:ribose transport system substrate-binding protein
MTTDVAAASPSESQVSSPPRRRTSARRILIYLLVAFILITYLLWQAGALRPQPKVALVTASSGPYWDQVVAGAHDAANRYHLKLAVLRPHADEPSQSQAIESLLGKHFDGVAISPNDAPRQAAVLSKVAAEMPLVTYDSDCPVAGKLLFIGIDNYDAGRAVGTYIKQAVPDGGEVLIAIGSLDKENGQRRRQGVIDELLDRTVEKARPMDAVEEPLKGPKYTVAATLVDGIEPIKATAMMAEGLRAHPNVKAVACLFAYNTPSALKALKDAGKDGKVQVVGFDTNEETLTGIENGTVYATMMQSPYSIGFEAVRVLGDVARGERESLPMFSTFYLNCDGVTKSNVADVRNDLSKKQHGATTQPSASASAT